MEQALRLFKERGYEKTSVLEICRAANVSEGTFYYHFPTKDDLVRLLVLDPEVMSAVSLGELLSCDTYFEQLVEFLNAVSNYALDVEPEIMRVYFTTVARHDSEGALKEAFDRQLSVMLPLITKAQRAGEIRNQSDPAVLAKIVDRMYIGSFLNWGYQNGRYDLKKALREKLEALFDVRDDLRTSGISESTLGT